MHSSEIPVAHTPSGGYGATFPPLILGDCTEPLVAGAPDLRGIWIAVSATRGGAQVPPDDRLMSYTERIEQCGNRIVDCGGGTIADCRADGTEENACTTFPFLTTQHQFTLWQVMRILYLYCAQWAFLELKSHDVLTKAET